LLHGAEFDNKDSALAKGLFMVEIEFSMMVGAPGDADHLLPLLDEFRKQYNIQVNLTDVTWDSGWGEIVKFGIYKRGPDVSTIGTTWIGSLASMQALRPYDDQEIHALGGAEAFFESIWRTGFLQNDPTLWSVPYLGDAMLLYYWKKYLKKAGISDFETAFATDDALAETLGKLQRSGIDYPLAINLKSDSTILHEAAHWVWNAGGDFVSPDGRQVAFTQPPAMQGFRSYFKLRPYISPEFLKIRSTAGPFNTGKAAVHFAGPWLVTSFHQNKEQIEDAPNVVAIPGITFTGGCGLVIWQYTLHPREAFELVRFLATQPVHIPKSLVDHQVPVRREAVHMPLMANDDYHRAYLEAIQRGRAFPTMGLWGAIEDKLRAALGNIWIDLFANPNQDLDACIHKHLDPIAQRLNITLGN
jgi:multiple sugar transport system substrate-binding protein